VSIAGSPHLACPRVVAAGGLAALLGAADLARAEQFLLIRRDRQVEAVGIAEIGERTMVVGDRDRGWTRIDLSQCVALVHVEALPALPRAGLLRLGDGQRFPGEALSGARAAEDLFVWNHTSWLGRMEVALERIESVSFVPGAAVPHPQRGDALLLANGDRIDGFVTALGDPIVIETGDPAAGGGEIVEVPLERAVAVRLSPPPRPASGRRLWLADGTVMDVTGLVVGDDGLVRIAGGPFGTEPLLRPIGLSSLLAVQFDRGGLTPLAALRPQEVSGPSTRYRVPPPATLDELAPLGLSRISLCGPLSVRYRLPWSPAHLSAEARLAETARAWGDCELVVRDGRREAMRVRLNGSSPHAVLAIDLAGPTFEMEVTEGAHGPIQDHVVLHRAMLLGD
jgi:hypothetical protein